MNKAMESILKNLILKAGVSVVFLLNGDRSVSETLCPVEHQLALEKKEMKNKI